MKKKNVKQLKLPNTKLRQKVGVIKTTRSGYILNKNGKPTNYKIDLKKE
jgi:hypothetical protein